MPCSPCIDILSYTLMWKKMFWNVLSIYMHACNCIYNVLQTHFKMLIYCRWASVCKDATYLTKYVLCKYNFICSQACIVFEMYLAERSCLFVNIQHSWSLFSWKLAFYVVILTSLFNYKSTMLEPSSSLLCWCECLYKYHSRWCSPAGVEAHSVEKFVSLEPWV